MKATLRWLQARADNVAVGLLTAMFVSFVLQIFSRYVLNHPIGWTLEACLITWLWIVFWGSAFLVDDHQHVKFDVLYTAARRRIRTVFALLSAIAIATAFLVSLPATFDFVTFMKIEKSSMLGIRLDYVFFVYVIFAVAIIIRYVSRAISLIRGTPITQLEGELGKVVDETIQTTR